MITITIILRVTITRGPAAPKTTSSVGLHKIFKGFRPKISSRLRWPLESATWYAIPGPNAVHNKGEVYLLLPGLCRTGLLIEIHYFRLSVNEAEGSESIALLLNRLLTNSKGKKMIVYMGIRAIIVCSISLKSQASEPEVMLARLIEGKIYRLQFYLSLWKVLNTHALVFTVWRKKK